MAVRRNVGSERQSASEQPLRAIDDGETVIENHSEIVSFIWGVADLIRDTFKRGKYQDVILPLTVLRRLDCVLAPTKPKVLKRHAALKGKLKKLDDQLCKASGFAFYNTSPFDFEKLLADANNIAANLRTGLSQVLCGAGGRAEELREPCGNST